MKKLLDSDWLRVVQFKCNNSANYIHIVIMDYDWRKDNKKFYRPMILFKAMTRILCGNSEKGFLECEKKGFKDVRANCFCASLLRTRITCHVMHRARALSNKMKK